MEDKGNKSKLIPQSKQRLIFLGAVLVGLILFYLGIDTWLKQQNAKNQPPPIVIKPVSPIKPPQEEKKEEKKAEIPKQEQPKQTEQKQETQEKPMTPKKEEKRVKTVEKKTETRKKLITKTYKFQIGSFRYKNNAYKMKEMAKKKGFRAEVVKRKGFYRVYVYVNARNLREAKRIVLSHFKEAVYVRK